MEKYTGSLGMNLFLFHTVKKISTNDPLGGIQNCKVDNCVALSAVLIIITSWEM